MEPNNSTSHLQHAGAAMPPPDELLALLREAASILILGHRNPDGDAVASTLGLALIVGRLGNSATVLLPGALPEWAHAVPGKEMISDTVPDDFDAVITVDCANSGRLGEVSSALDTDRPCAEIDHHEGDDRICDIVYVDTDASAAGVLIHRIARALQMTIDADLATCIYWAIATDTGFFSFSNTNPEAMCICAEAIDAGAEPEKIARVVRAKSLPHQRLKGRALTSLEVHLDGQLLLSALTPDDFRLAGAVRSDTEGVIDELTTIPGPLIYALFKSVNGEEDWEVSLRSNTLNCTKIAAHFDGGGHQQASGYPFEGSLEEGRRRLVEAVAGVLDHE